MNNNTYTNRRVLVIAYNICKTLNYKNKVKFAKYITDNITDVYCKSKCYDQDVFNDELKLAQTKINDFINNKINNECECLSQYLSEEGLDISNIDYNAACCLWSYGSMLDIIGTKYKKNTPTISCYRCFMWAVLSDINKSLDFIMYGLYLIQNQNCRSCD